MGNERPDPLRRAGLFGDADTMATMADENDHQRVGRVLLEATVSLMVAHEEEVMRRPGGGAL